VVQHLVSDITCGPTFSMCIFIFYRATFYKVHVMEEGYFQLVVHHSGTFCDARYVGG